MKVSLKVPVVFRAPLSRSGGLRSIVTFVEASFDLQDITSVEAPLAVSHVLRANVLVRDYRLHEGKLVSATRRLNTNPDGTDPLVVLSFQIEQSLAKAAADELRAAGLGNVHPREAIDILESFVKPDSSGNGVAARREQYTMSAAERTADARTRNLISVSPDFDDSQSSWVARAAQLVGDNVVIDGKPFKASKGLTIRLHQSGQRYLVTELDISTVDGGSGNSWETQLGRMSGNALNTWQYYFGGADMDDTVQFAQENATVKNLQFEWDETKQPEYLIPRELVPSIDMRYPELVRAAKAIAFVVGSEIARRFKRQEFAVFNDDPAIRYAFDGLRDVVVTADPFGEPDDRIETALTNLLAALRIRPAETNATYRNIFRQFSDVFEFADTALARWEERPMEIKLEHRPISGRRP
jgi:hypothetical protein